MRLKDHVFEPALASYLEELVPIQWDQRFFTNRERSQIKRFLCHLAYEGLFGLGRSTFKVWVPIPWTTLHVEARTVTRSFGTDKGYELLEKLGLIETTNYDRHRRLCREYRLAWKHLKALIIRMVSLFHLDHHPWGQDRRQDHILLKAVLGRVEGKRLPRNKISVPLTTHSLRVMKNRYVDFPGLVTHMYQSYRDRAKNVGGSWNRFKANLRVCYFLLRHLKLDTIGWYYRPRYKSGTTGRIHEIGGGLQNAPVEMKVRSLTTGQVNYDLAASQPTILISEFEQHGIDTQWLENYVENPKAKENAAQRCGISVACWKTIFCALLTGARLVKHPQSSIMQELEHHLGTWDAACEAFDRFHSYTQPLQKGIKDWIQVLLDTPAGVRGGKKWWRNKIGLRFVHHRNCGQRLMAFMVQGQESAFILTLVIELAKVGIPVVANEHDGFIAVGDLPLGACQQAAEKVGQGRWRFKIDAVGPSEGQGRSLEPYLREVEAGYKKQQGRTV